MSQITLPLKVPSSHPMTLPRQASQATSIAHPSSAVPTTASTAHTAVPQPFLPTFPSKPLNQKHSFPSDGQRFNSNISIASQQQLPANRYASNYSFPARPHLMGSSNLPNLTYPGKAPYHSHYGMNTGNHHLAIENSDSKDSECAPSRNSSSEECTAVRNYKEMTNQVSNIDVMRKQSPSSARLNFHPQISPKECPPPNPPAFAWSAPPPRITSRNCFVMKPTNFGAYRRLPGQRPCDPPCFSTTLQRQCIPFGTMPPTFHHFPSLTARPFNGSDASIAAYGALGDCNSRRAATPYPQFPKHLGTPASGRGDDWHNDFNPYSYYYQ